jgi:voltage-gated potassium channel
MDMGLDIEQLILVDFIMFWFFAIDFAIRIFISLNKWRRLRQWDSLIDIAAGASVCVAFAGVRTGSGRVVNLSYLRVALVLQFAETGALAAHAGNVTRQIVRLLTIVLLLIMFAAASFYLVEAERPSNDFPNLYQSFYFLIVTFSTVGYGDISAQTELGRAVVMVAIGIGLIVIPIELSALSELLWSQSEFAGSYDLSRGEHVVLCGDLTVERMIGMRRANDSASIIIFTRT